MALSLCFAALCRELPWDINFWHNSLVYSIERAQHNSPLHMKESPRLDRNSRAREPNNRSLCEERLGRAWWPLLLTCAQRLALPPHALFFQPTLPGVRKHHETRLWPHQSGLITLAAWAKLSVWLRRLSGVGRWMMEQMKPVWEVEAEDSGLGL